MVGTFVRRQAEGEKAARELLQLGLQAESRMDWDDAIRQYQSLIDKAPTDTTLLYFAHNNKGYSLIQVSRFDEAVGHCEKAIEIDDRRHNAYKNLGLAYQGIGKVISAAECFVDACFRNAADKRAWLHLQRLLDVNRGVLTTSPELAERIETIQKFYEEDGGVPTISRCRSC